MTARNNGLPASEKKKRAGSIAKHISFTGVFAALCFVATVIVKIPQPSGGYFNLGDAFVLLSGWFLGPAYGAVAAGLGPPPSSSKPPWLSSLILSPNCSKNLSKRKSSTCFPVSSPHSPPKPSW